jgi:HK97 family phage portal protein
MNLFQRVKAGFRRFVKAIPWSGYGGSGGMSRTDGWGWGWTWNQYPNTRINFAREVGDLTLSSLIMAAANWVGTALPEAPIGVLERKDGNVYEPVPDHPMVDLLENPNQYHAGELLWKAWALSWIIDGNAYFLKWRDGFNFVNRLTYEPHFTIQPRYPEDGSEFISFYEVYRDGRWFRIETRDVIHFRFGINPHNVRLGLSPVGALLREVFTDNERARYAALLLRNGGVIPYVLTPEAGVSHKGVNAQEIKDEWMSRTTGDQIGKPIVLSGPMKVQMIGVSPDQLLVEKASAIPEQRVAAVLGIPAAVLGFGVGLEQTKVGATMRELREQAWESYIIPTHRIIAGELKSQLLVDWGETTNLRVAHDLSEVRILQEDRDKLYQRETLAYEKGVKTRAEARSALGMETTPEDEVYFTEPRSMQEPDEPMDELPLDEDGEERQPVNGRASS